MQSLQHSCLRVTMLLQGHLGPADKVPEAQAAQARAHRPAQHCFEAVQEHSQVRGGGLTGVTNYRYDLKKRKEKKEGKEKSKLYPKHK